MTEKNSKNCVYCPERDVWGLRLALQHNTRILSKLGHKHKHKSFSIQYSSVTPPLNAIHCPKIDIIIKQRGNWIYFWQIRTLKFLIAHMIQNTYMHWLHKFLILFIQSSLSSHEAVRSSEKLNFNSGTGSKQHITIRHLLAGG